MTSRDATTPSGFSHWLKNAELNTGVGQWENVVQVMAYHGAKGLEWPVVILTSLNEGARDNPV